MGIMPAMEVVVRAARPSDPADGLLFASAAPYYTAYAGWGVTLYLLGFFLAWQVAQIQSVGL